MVFQMRLTKLLLSLLGGAAFVSVGMQGAQAAVIPGSDLLNDYLVIATGGGSVPTGQFESFSMSNTELGADQEVLSKAGSGHPQRLGSLLAGNVPSLFDVFAGTPGANAALGGNRWNDSDNAGGNGQTTGEVDRLPGARPLFEGIDHSGNVALTGPRSTFATSNSDVNATTGIQCRTATVDCTTLSGNNSYFDDSAPNTNTPLTSSNGVSQFVGSQLPDLVVDLAATRDFIVGLSAETVFAQSSFTTANGLPHTEGENTGAGSNFANAFVNRNIKDTNGVVVTDLDAIDTNGDGFAVININAGSNEFILNNTDWILKSTKDTVAIFRLVGQTKNYQFTNSSIMLGDGNPDSTDTIDQLGAIFFTDALKGTNEVFNLNNVILGGIGLWDFTDFNPRVGIRLFDVAGDGVGSSYHTNRAGSLTKLNLQNSQGCAQFIGHEIDMSNNRWQRCDQIASVPEPSAWLLFGFGMIGIELVRRSQQARRQAARI